MNSDDIDINVDRRQFLKIAAASGGAAMLAGCGGGGSDISPTQGGDLGTVTSTQDGEPGSGTSTRTQTTTGSGSGPVAGRPCGNLVQSGYNRYNGAGKPILFTFEYPAGWEIISEVSIPAAFSVNFENSFEIGDENYTYVAGVQGGREPIDDPDLEEFPEMGWTDFQFDFDGAPARVVLSPRGTADSNRVAFGYLPHDGPDGRTFHNVTIVLLADDEAQCTDIIEVIAERMITSIIPNEVGTFEPVEE